MVVIPATAVVLTMAGRRLYILFPYQNLCRLFFVFSFHDLSILYLSSLSTKFFNKFFIFFKSFDSKGLRAAGRGPEGKNFTGHQPTAFALPAQASLPVT